MWGVHPKGTTLPMLITCLIWGEHRSSNLFNFSVYLVVYCLLPPSALTSENSSPELTCRRVQWLQPRTTPGTRQHHQVSVGCGGSRGPLNGSRGSWEMEKGYAFGGQKGCVCMCVHACVCAHVCVCKSATCARAGACPKPAASILSEQEHGE